MIKNSFVFFIYCFISLGIITSSELKLLIWYGKFSLVLTVFFFTLVVLFLYLNNVYSKTKYAIPLFYLFILFLLMLSFNVSKLINHGSNLYNIVDALWISGLEFFLFAFIIGFVRNDGYILIKILNFISNFYSILILPAIIIWFFIFLNIEIKFSLEGLELGTDYPSSLGLYRNYYNLAYVPSWLLIPIGNGGYATRLTSLFWEPGTLGFYCLLLTIVELKILKSFSKFSSFRLSIFILAGILSFSLLFYVLFVFYLCVGLKNRYFIYGFIFLVLFVPALFFLVDTNSSIHTGFLYDFILKRLEFDSERGFSGNNRISSFNAFSNWCYQSQYYQLIFGMGPKAMFDGESTSYLSKIFYRGFLSIFLYVLIFLYFLKLTNYKLLKSQLIFLFIYFLGISQLSWDTGALSMISLIILCYSTNISGLNVYDKKMLCS